MTQFSEGGHSLNGKDSLVLGRWTADLTDHDKSDRILRTGSSSKGANFAFRSYEHGSQLWSSQFCPGQRAAAGDAIEICWHGVYTIYRADPPWCVGLSSPLEHSPLVGFDIGNAAC